jgi:hypothetical protein
MVQYTTRDGAASPDMKYAGTIYREDLIRLFDAFWSDVCVLVEQGCSGLLVAVEFRTKQLVEAMNILANERGFQWEVHHFKASQQGSPCREVPTGSCSHLSRSRSFTWNQRL